MANALIAWGNNVDGGSIYNGSWLSSLPLTNVLNRTLGLVARSNGLTLANTKFTIDLGPDKIVKVISLANHNFSLAAKYRITNTSGVNTGWLDVWPVVYDSQNLPWQSLSWWSGKYSAAEIEGFTWNLIHIFDTAYNNAIWTIEIDDQTNSAGYVQFGRLFMADAWQPVVNMSYGASLGWESNTEAQEMYSGAKVFDERTPYRVARFSLDWMSQDEALGNAFELQRRMGVSGEVVYVWDTDDTIHSIRRRFLGRMRQLSPIENPYVAIHKAAFEIEELL